MDYVRHVPGPPLDAFVDDLYYLEGPAPYPRMKVPPMPSEHLMVNLGEPFRIHDSDLATAPATCADSWCMGLWTRYYMVDWPFPVRLVGVHFKPGGLYPFLRVPLSELHDQVVPLAAIWGPLAVEVRERLHAAATKRAALVLLDELLRGRLAELVDQPPHGLSLVQHALGRLAGRYGAVSVRALSEHAGVSGNHLRTQFQRLVGVPPKRLARIYRFARVVGSVDAARQIDWSYLAHQAGYYDQSHFNKDFVAFTGHSPTEYQRLRRRFLAENPRHALDLGPLPTD